MASKELIAAIEIGSSAVHGTVGYRLPDGKLEVMKCVSEPSGEFIKNGVVRNIDKTAQCLTNIVNRLEGQLKNTTIERVYVGICGYTVHSVSNKVERMFDDEMRLTADIIDAMEEENCQSATSDRVVVKSIPQEYFADGVQISDPVGCNCRQLIGHYLNLEARYSAMENLRAAFEMAKVETADECIIPLSLSDVVLTAVDRNLGCALVDIGAGTTTVSVYKGDCLRFMAVIPLGDRLIVSDIVSLGIAADEAEEIYLRYGLSIKSDDASIYTTHSGNEVALRDIGFAIRARFHEMIENVEHQIRKAGFSGENLKSGFVFTGGTMMVPEAQNYVNRQPFFERVRLATSPSDVIWSKDEAPILSKQITLASLLNACTEPCCVQEEPQEIDYSQGNLTTGLLFDDYGESAQVERDRRKAAKLQEAAERRQKEKEERNRQQEKKVGRLSLFERLTKMVSDQLFDNDE